MASISKSALVPYTPAQMFVLVDDIDVYPRFLPWCRDAKVLSRSVDEVRATIVLSKGGVEKSFTTRNLIQKDKMIEMRLEEGPFKQLEDGCKISFDLEFEFASRMLDMVVGPVFSQIANSLVDSFHKRAMEMYDKP